MWRFITIKIHRSTAGKSENQFNKMAFTLIDSRSGRAVRVSLKPEFLTKALSSPFVQQRKAGVPPQDIAAEVAEPLVNNVLNMPDDNFLLIGPVQQVEVTQGKGVFEAQPCAKCRELTFVNKLQESAAGRVCIPCAQ